MCSKTKIAAFDWGFLKYKTKSVREIKTVAIKCLNQLSLIVFYIALIDHRNIHFVAYLLLHIKRQEYCKVHGNTKIFLLELLLRTK